MNKTTLAILLAAGLTGACTHKDTQEQKVETKNKQTEDGQAIKSETEVKQDTPVGTIETVNKTYLGTVTGFTAGRKMTVETADGRTHDFDLDETNVDVNVEPNVRVGSRVEVIVERHEGRTRKLSVVPHA